MAAPWPSSAMDAVRASSATGVNRRRGKGLSGPCFWLMGHRASRLVLLLFFFCSITEEANTLLENKRKKKSKYIFKPCFLVLQSFLLLLI